MSFQLYLIVMAVVVTAVSAWRLLYWAPAQKARLAALSDIPPEKRSYLFVENHILLRKVDDKAPAMDPSKRQKSHCCVQLSAGQHTLNVRFAQTSVIGSHVYNNETLTYDFEPGATYSLKAVMPDRRSVEYVFEKL